MLTPLDPRNQKSHSHGLHQRMDMDASYPLVVAHRLMCKVTQSLNTAKAGARRKPSPSPSLHSAVFKKLLSEFRRGVDHKRGWCLAGSYGKDRKITDSVRLSVSAAHVDRKRTTWTVFVYPRPKCPNCIQMATTVILVYLVFKSPKLAHHALPFLRLHVGQRACMS